MNSPWALAVSAGTSPAVLTRPTPRPPSARRAFANTVSTSRVSRVERLTLSSFATITVSTRPALTIRATFDHPARSRFLPLAPASSTISCRVMPAAAAAAVMRARCASRPSPEAACSWLLTRMYPMAVASHAFNLHHAVKHYQAKVPSLDTLTALHHVKNRVKHWTPGRGPVQRHDMGTNTTKPKRRGAGPRLVDGRMSVAAGPALARRVAAAAERCGVSHGVILREAIAAGLPAAMRKLQREAEADA